MVKSIKVAQTKLDYPLYGCDFVGSSGEYVLVGGGGGESKSGVKNKLTLLELDGLRTLSTVGEIVLSSDEDSVTSLATTEYAVSDDTFRAFVGINSSQKSQKDGVNEHLRSFLVQPDVEKPEDAVVFEAKSGHFRPSEAVLKESYQRLVKLSPCHIDGKDLSDLTVPRLGVAATGLAEVGEFVFFDPRQQSSSSNNLGSLTLGPKAEAADFDIRTTEEGEFQLLYCTNAELFIVDIPSPSKKGGKLKIADPKLLFTRKSTTAGSPTFRGVRFLTATLALLLVNQPGQTGADLFVLRINEDGASLVLRKRLDKSIKAATRMDVAVLGDNQGDEKQFVIAVSGNNICVEVVTLDFTAEKGLQKFVPVKIFKDFHPWSITSLKFAPFRRTKSLEPQYLKLLTVSSANTAVVHSFELHPVAYPPKISHYVVNRTRKRGSISIAHIILPLVLALLSTLLLQTGLEQAGFIEPGSDLIPPHLRYKAEQFMANSILFNPMMLPADRLFPWAPLEMVDVEREELHTQDPQILAKAGDDEHIVLREVGGEIIKDVHTDSEVAEQHGIKWEDLTIKQRELWKEKLKETGDYVAGQGESIFKGVLFGELAGAVGRAVAG